MTKERLAKLCLLNGVSGFEDEVREHIISEIKPYATTINIDNAGNIIAYKKGLSSRNKVFMVCAHMDEVGLIITGVTDDGYLKFTNIGGIDERILPGSVVNIPKRNGKDIKGIIGVTAVHMLTKEEREKAIKTDDLFIDIGCSSKVDALNLISPGDTAVFDSDFSTMGDGFIKCKAIDDRVGCLALIDIIKESINYDTYFVFSAKEEIGLFGSPVASNIIKPDFCIVVETTTANDLPKVDEHSNVCALKSGVVIPFMDKAAIYDKDLYKAAGDIADANSIKWQTKNVIAGGNDAGAISKSGHGCKALSLSVPSRYLHTPYCLVHEDDIVQLEKLLILMINN